MKEIYIKGPVLAPGSIGRPELGLTDRPLTAEEIQKAAYSFLPGSPIVDRQHDFKKQAEVVESYVTPDKTEFNNEEYPPGTWFITSKVTDPKLQKEINEGKLTGYSIGALPSKFKKEFVKKGLFQDVAEGEWFPLAVSMVSMPFYPEMIFKVFQHDDIIKKNAKTEVENVNEDKTMLKMFDKLLDMVSIKKEASENKENTEKEDEGGDSSIQEQLGKIFEMLKKIDERLTQLEEEDEEESKEDEKQAEDEIKKSLDEDEGNKSAENVAVEDGVISKSIGIDNAQSTAPTSFMGSIGCDSAGRNQKYLKKA